MLHNWRAKIGSLLIGFAIWYLIKVSIDPQGVSWRALREETGVIQRP